MTVAFVTPGLIDMRSFTINGFNAKPNSTNPIGFFGTGLKLSVAICCRIGATMTVYRGLDRYDFVQRDVDFRGKGFKQVFMRSEKWKMRARTTELPFTTEYGKNWKPWMVFRELYSNTLDEGGEVHSIPDAAAGICPDDDHTVIVVSHVDVDKAYAERREIFTEATVLAGDEHIKVREGAGVRAYYRGVRAKTLGAPALFTYDFSRTMALTEDRTFESEYYMKEDVARFVAQGCDDERVIEAVVTAGEKTWERDLSFNQYWTPSEAFKRVMARRPRGVTPAAGGFYGFHLRTSAPPPSSPWAAAPRPWALSEADDVVVDASGDPLFRKPWDFAGDWRPLGKELARVGNATTAAPPPEASSDVEDDSEEGEPPAPGLGEDIPF